MSKFDNRQQAEWQQHVTAYRNGKLSGVAYCKLHSIKYHQFGYWIKSKRSKIPPFKLRAI